MLSIVKEFCPDKMISETVLSDFTEWLSEKGIHFQKNVELAKLSHIKAGGCCRVLVKPTTEDQLAVLLRMLAERGIPYKVLGNLSNVLFRDGDIRTVCISTRGLRGLHIHDETVTAEAGVMLPTLARRLVHLGFQGFAGLVGVPASIGGAVFMNASCYGDAISDYLLDVRCMDRNGNAYVFGVSELGFTWRHSAFHDRLAGYIILAARFRLIPGSKTAEIERMERVKIDRKTYQENALPNLGSTFATIDIYGDIAKRFFGYKCGLFLVKLITRLLRVITMRRCHWYPGLARQYTKFYFRLKGSNAVDYSASTFNCVVNLGGAKADDIIDFVIETHRAIGKCVPLEIELWKDIE